MLFRLMPSSSRAPARFYSIYEFYGFYTTSRSRPLLFFLAFKASFSPIVGATQAHAFVLPSMLTASRLRSARFTQFTNFYGFFTTFRRRSLLFILAFEPFSHLLLVLSRLMPSFFRACWLFFDPSRPEFIQLRILWVLYYFST